MKKSFNKIILLTFIIVSIGLGCSDTKTNSVNQKKVIDESLGISAIVPPKWESTKFNTLYKDIKKPSGYSYVQGATNYGFGEKNEAGELQIKVHVIAIPRSSVPVFEKAPFPTSARRAFELDDYVIYTAVMGGFDQDPAVLSFIQSLSEGR